MEANSDNVSVRRLRNGDARTVMGVFDRLSERSRRARFNGPKHCLAFGELRQLASVDRTRYALVAYVDGDPQPVAIGRFVRDGHSAEIAFAVADEYQRRGIGSSIAAKLIADARAAGITEVVAFVSSNNRAAIALLRRVLNAMEMYLEGPELVIHAAIA
jgi:protein lysine acetyltransferase